jgi:hypothetical protein
VTAVIIAALSAAAGALLALPVALPPRDYPVGRLITTLLDRDRRRWRADLLYRASARNALHQARVDLEYVQGALDATYARLHQTRRSAPGQPLIEAWWTPASQPREVARVLVAA